MDGQKEKIGKANEKRKREKAKRAKDEEVKGQGRKKKGKGCSSPTWSCKASKFGEITLLCRSRSFKVTDVSTKKRQYVTSY